MQMFLGRRVAHGKHKLGKWYESVVRTWDLTDEQVIGDLLGCVSTDFDATAIRWQSFGHPSPVWWPSASYDRSREVGIEAVQSDAGGSLSAAVDDGRVQRGTLTIFGESAEALNAEWARHGQVVLDCLRLVLARERLRAAKGPLVAEVDEASAAAAALRRRLSVLVEAERRRLVADLLEDLGGSMGSLTAVVDSTQERINEGMPVTAGLVDEINHCLTGVLEHFRQTARGIYPAMLRERGIREALLAYAAAAGGKFCLTGDCGRRSQWQIESVLFRATLARMQLLAKSAHSDAIIDVRLGRRGEVLLVELRVPVQPFQETLGLALIVVAETELIRAFGGDEVMGREGNAAIFRLSLSEKAFAAV